MNNYLKSIGEFINEEKLNFSAEKFRKLVLSKSGDVTTLELIPAKDGDTKYKKLVIGRDADVPDTKNNKIDYYIIYHESGHPLDGKLVATISEPWWNDVQKSNDYSVNILDRKSKPENLQFTGMAYLGINDLFKWIIKTIDKISSK